MKKSRRGEAGATSVSTDKLVEEALNTINMTRWMEVIGCLCRFNRYTFSPENFLAGEYIYNTLAAVPQLQVPLPPMPNKSARFLHVYEGGISGVYHAGDGACYKKRHRYSARQLAQRAKQRKGLPRRRPLRLDLGGPDDICPGRG